jgi:heptaprenylglyceryl phosphate synthase
MVRAATTVPYIVGGGIRTEEHLSTAFRAGADVCQIGTALEESKSVKELVQKFAKLTKEEGAKKV